MPNMKTLLLFPALILCSSFIESSETLDCSNFRYAISEAEDNAEEAADYARRAYYEDDIDDAHDYLRRARSYAEEAMDAASDAETHAYNCDCSMGASYASDAESEAEDAYDYARKGINSDDIEDVHDYARRARSSADDAESAASSGQFYCDDRR